MTLEECRFLENCNGEAKKLGTNVSLVGGSHLLLVKQRLRESDGFAAQATSFLAELNSMTFPFCSAEIHFDVFFWKWLGT